jgi:hypothetical protein
VAIARTSRLSKPQSSSDCLHLFPILPLLPPPAPRPNGRQLHQELNKTEVRLWTDTGDTRQRCG